MKAYTADRIFTGDHWLDKKSILSENGIIKDVIEADALPRGIENKFFQNCSIVPAFIDLQIYGAYGKLLAVYPQADSLFALNEYCKKGGAAFCLAAVATNTREVFFKCIDAVKDYWEKDGDGILGLHLEGPWLNPEKRGAHIESLIHTPALKEVKDLLEYGKGVIKMITIAPEVCSKEVIDLILSYEIIITAGHSNATYTEAMQGFENGITAVTHLYNAMSPLQHRQPGLAGAAMDHPSVMASIIPDGYHVDYAAIRIAKKVMSDRLFVITDAVTETDEGYYQHQLAGDKYEASGILSGSALTMAKAVDNLVSHCKINLSETLRMCSLYPARVIKMDSVLGKIGKNYHTKLTVLDKDLKVVDIIF
ncbi:MAG: N-acetylglucosamine-6-phosphate deacetylase [Bacteroidetes bacterium]|nr:N-acetylglucosamine-6-phosphate deacetylase [Bacteroidota bacterium]MBS1929905.1 N-acetylglucosamine-6-phosphate deacetylase [Bacteroidota bacterium]